MNLSIKLFWTLDNFGNTVEKSLRGAGFEGKNCQRGSGEVENKADTGAGEEVESTYLRGQFEFGKGQEGGI